MDLYGRRFRFDHGLLSSLADRWQPHTNTFHLPVGEMTITLEDTEKLLRLALDGDAVAPVEVEKNWKVELLERFSKAELLSEGATFHQIHG